MSSTDYVRNLYEYNEWANNLVLKAASALSEEQLGRELGASFGSVRANLVHTAGAQIVWLGRWTGERSEALALLAGDPGVDAIRQACEMSHVELRRFVGSLQEGDLKRMVRYRDREGNAREGTLWKMLLQVVNHGTQHRSETAMLLTSLGSSPGDLDYSHFCDIRGSEAPGTLEMIRNLYEYNEWANGKVLKALSGLGDEELMRPRGVSHSSLGMDLLHLLGAQVGWLGHLAGGGAADSAACRRGRALSRQPGQLVRAVARGDPGVHRLAERGGAGAPPYRQPAGE